MTPWLRGVRIAVLAILAVCLLPAAEPLSREQILQVVSAGGLSEDELAAIISSRGVDFVLDGGIAEQLRAAGAGNTVLIAIGNSGPKPAAGGAAQPKPVAVRPPAPSPERRTVPGTASANTAASGNPLGLSQIQLALESGADQSRLRQMVQQRGLDFAFTPEIGRKLQAAGAGSELLAAIALARVAESGPGETAPAMPELPEGYVPLPVARASDYDPYANQGRLDLRMFVDGTTEIRIRGDKIIHTNLDARLGRNAGTEMTQPLPAAELKSLEAEKKDGRGKWVILQRPSAANQYQLTLRIYDNKGGEDRYHIQVQWEKAE